MVIAAEEFPASRRGMVVERPSPTDMDDLREAHSSGRLVYLGTRGQIDPTRGAPIGRRVVGAVSGSLVLVLRRLQGRPILWVRRSTLRPRRTRDPVERILARMFRVFARQVSIDEVAELVDGADDARG